jgi:hypothetical protein
MKKLNISPDLQLPTEAVTQTFGILAKRGVGKTYTASVMVEEMLKAKLHVIVIDPIGVWWGLRAAADGKSEGLQIVIAGGEHADVPITPDSGEALADLIVENQISIVVDVSLFRKGEQVKFMTAFAETLYRRNRSAVHLVLDEADAFAPQRPFGNEARLLGAIEDIVRRGRARGIGVTMITQRPAVLNKNVLTQIEVLVVLRLTSPQDRAAIGEWVKMNADPDQASQMLGTLQQLPVGTAWFYSPGWLDLFKKVHIRTRETFDSSSTPKVGEKIIRPENMASVDLDEIRRKLDETIQRVEAEDPKALKKRIAQLEGELIKSSKNLQAPKVEIREKIVEVVPEELRSLVIDRAKEIETIANGLRMKLEFLDNWLRVGVNQAKAGSDKNVLTMVPVNPEDPSGGYISKESKRENSSFAKPNANKTPEVVNLPKADKMQMTETQSKTGGGPYTHSFTGGNGLPQFTIDRAQPGGDRSVTMIREGDEVRELSKYAQDLLDTFIKHWPMQLTRMQLSTLSGKSRKSSSFAGAIAEIIAAGLIHSDDGSYELTQQGVELAGLSYTAKLKPELKINLWLNALPAYEKDLFTTLLQHKTGLTREELANVTNRSLTSSAFAGAISTLVKNGLAQAELGMVRISERFLTE